MGNIYKATCPECGYDTQLHLGGGLNSIDPSFLLRCADEKDRTEIIKLQEYGIKHIIGENRLLSCCDCSKGELSESLIIDLIDKDGILHTFGRDCPKCGRVREILDISQAVVCPRCGKGALRFDVYGRWD